MTKKNQTPKNHVFDLHQHAAFALASNQAFETNFESIVKSQHFYNLVNKGGIYFHKNLVFNLLENIRNYSSHYHHIDLEPLSEELFEFFSFIEKRARQLFYVRHQNGKTENKPMR